VIEQKFEGFKELADQLRALPAELVSRSGGPLRAALQKSAKLIIDDAKGRAPKDTGVLQKGIRVKRVPNPPAGVTERVAIKPRAFYWHMVEFGTEKMPAQPFMRPAFEAKKVAVVEAFRDELGKAIQRAIKRGKKRGIL
jgi:HK97 gp10 family phage protein